MSHFVVLVALAPTDDVDEALDKALAPFDEELEVEPYREYMDDGMAKYHRAVEYYNENPDQHGEWDDSDVIAVLSAYMGESVAVDDGRYYTLSTYSPRSKWDWYQVGGRWNKYFPYRAEAIMDDRLINGARSWASAPEDPNKAFWCDGGPLELLDLEFMRDTKEREAVEQWDRFHAIADQYPDAKPWSHFVALIKSSENYTIDDAREHYRQQPAVQALQGVKEFQFWFGGLFEAFSQSREEHARLARDGAVVGYALLTLEGEWVQPGEMGWFGISNDTDESRGEYNKKANEYIESLPGDTVLVCVDCHI